MVTKQYAREDRDREGYLKGLMNNVQPKYRNGNSGNVDSPSSQVDRVEEYHHYDADQ